MTLVLSLFPGIGLLDRAFEDEGFTIVRGPDLLWVGDIRSFHPPAGRFDGVIGGPPCQMFSRLANLIRAQGRTPRYGNLIPEYERVVAAAEPGWFLMENVPEAPVPVIEGYSGKDFVIDNAWLGEEQMRKRRFTFGVRGGAPHDLRRDIAFTALMLPDGRQRQALLSDRRAVPVAIGGSGRRKKSLVRTVTSSDGGHSNHPNAVRTPRYDIGTASELQGLPRDFLSWAPFTVAGKLAVVANGVPLPMGRAIAKAVKAAISEPAGSQREAGE
jgi:DNA (cytosine-5)-methyltransferase 1